MTPDDLRIVERTWSELRRRRDPLLAGLTRRFEAAAPAPIPPAVRASWLVGAVEELVGLLSAPSRLAARARRLGETWPDPLAAPSFGVDGHAWMAAAGACLPNWSERTEAAWRQAWHLLSDVLVTETLSPFPGEGRPGEGGLRMFPEPQITTNEGPLL
jgi:hypothetical protein